MFSFIPGSFIFFLVVVLLTVIILLLYQTKQKEDIGQGNNFRQFMSFYEKMIKDNSNLIRKVVDKQEDFIKNSENLLERISGRVLNEKKEKLEDINRKNISDIMLPYKERIKGFLSEIANIKKSYEGCILHFSQSITEFKRSFEITMLESKLLREALSYRPNAIGVWGENTLRRILEISGFKIGIDYDIRKEFLNSLKPDFVIKLPDNKLLIIDSKVNFSSYKKYSQAKSIEEKEAFKKDFVKDIKRNIKDVEKYLKIEGSLDFVLIFIPIESAFQCLLEYYTDIFDKFNSRKVFLVSPYSIIVFLKLVRKDWNDYRLSKEQEEVLLHTEKLCFKIVSFYQEFEKLGKGIRNVNSIYEDMQKKLQFGKGSILKKVDRLGSLGIKTGLENHNKL